MRKIRLDAFNEAPEDMAWRVRDTWLRNVSDGLNPVQDELIPVLEMEAARILRKETLISISGEPNRLENSESWRLWWMNEAHHLSSHNGLTPDADYELPANSRHAINVLSAASELRAAMKSQNVERIALFATLLVLEAIQGGYSMEFDAAKEANELLNKKRADTYKKSIGVEADDHERARKVCIKEASKLWKADPKLLIGAVAEKLNELLLDNFEKLPSLDKSPQPNTIKGWIKDAAKEGKLTIPQGAQRRGRPANHTK